MLVRRGRVSLSMGAADWIAHALAVDRSELVAMDGATAVAAALLPDRFPRDPADRIIYATARGSDAPLVTKDAALRDFDPAGTVW